jgi:hypothetical protein
MSLAAAYRIQRGTTPHGGYPSPEFPVIGSDAAMTVTLFGAVASLAWSATVAWVYWLKHRFDSSSPTKPGAFDDVCGARLEAAVDALSIEAERLGEAQRYAVRLLEERLPTALPARTPTHLPEGGRAIAPH